MHFLVLKLCVYTHKPLLIVAGHCFALGFVGGVCPCSMDGCTAFLVPPTCRSVQSVRNSRGPKAPLLLRSTAREFFRLQLVRVLMASGAL